MPASRLRSTYLAAPALALALVSVLMAAALALWLPVEALKQVMREDGVVETATAFLYLISAGAVCLVRNAAFGISAKVASTIVLGSCIAREVSVRKWLLNADAGAYCCTPAQAQIVIGVLLVTLVAAGAWLAARYRRTLVTGFRQRKRVAVTIVTIFGCAVLSQILDRVPKAMLAVFGHVVSSKGRALALSMEEVLEMLLPILVILAVAQSNGPANEARERGSHAHAPR